MSRGSGGLYPSDQTVPGHSYSVVFSDCYEKYEEW